MRTLTLNTNLNLVNTMCIRPQEGFALFKS